MPSGAEGISSSRSICRFVRPSIRPALTSLSIPNGSLGFLRGPLGFLTFPYVSLLFHRVPWGSLVGSLRGS